MRREGERLRLIDLASGKPLLTHEEIRDSDRRKDEEIRRKDEEIARLRRELESR